HILVGGQRFYERKEIKDALAYLRVVLNPSDDVSVRRVVNVPGRGLGPGALGKVDAWAVERGVTLFEAMTDPMLEQTLPKKPLQG
ncbi:3'-5' exonuclease, partial [Acinetobacter baumannii]